MKSASARAPDLELVGDLPGRQAGGRVLALSALLIRTRAREETWVNVLCDSLLFVPEELDRALSGPVRAEEVSMPDDAIVASGGGSYRSAQRGAVPPFLAEFPLGDAERRFTAGLAQAMRSGMVVEVCSWPLLLLGGFDDEHEWRLLFRDHENTHRLVPAVTVEPARPRADPQRARRTDAGFWVFDREDES